jgi:hypothetical protein
MPGASDALPAPAPMSAAVLARYWENALPRPARLVSVNIAHAALPQALHKRHRHFGSVCCLSREDSPVKTRLALGPRGRAIARATLASVADFVLANLGHCTVCMRKSFTVAAAAWALFVVAVLAAPEWIALLLAIAATLLSALWLAHLLVFSWKASASAGTAMQRDKPSPVISRRELLPGFVRAFAFAVGSTALPAVFFAAQAQTPCDSCSRYKGTGTCYTCCSCQNGNCVAGCKNSRDYNTCINGCSTTFGNCNTACR